MLANATIGLAFFDRDIRFVRVNNFLARINGISVAVHCLCTSPPSLTRGFIVRRQWWGRTPSDSGLAAKVTTEATACAGWRYRFNSTGVPRQLGIKIR